MATNTLNHVSDDSKYKTFNPAGTAFSSNIVNVQAALAAIKPQAVNGIPNASQNLVGILRFGTQGEVDAGTLDNVAVSPATFKAAITRPQATTTVIGLTRYATDSESVTGTERNAAVVPAGLKAHTNDLWNRIWLRNATEGQTGVLKISTEVQAKTGTDDTTAMSPKKVLMAINEATAKFPSPAQATESATGTVQLATLAQVAQGTLRNGWAVSPYSLRGLTSLENRAGLIRLATPAEVSTGTVADAAVTPKSMLSRLAGDNRVGMVKTTRTANPGNGDMTTALAVGADVVNLRGGQTINGSLNINGNFTAGNTTVPNLNATGTLKRNGVDVVTVDQLTDDVPIGCIMIWAGPSNVIPEKWSIADGGDGPNTTEFKRVFPNNKKPDMRGLFLRGVGRHPDMASRSGDVLGGKDVGFGCTGNNVGVVKHQTIRRHKHNSGWGEHNNRSDAYFGSTAKNGFRGSRKTDSDNWLYFTNDGEEWAPGGSDAFGTMNPNGLMTFENQPWNMSVYYIIKIR